MIIFQSYSSRLLHPPCNHWIWNLFTKLSQQLMVQWDSVSLLGSARWKKPLKNCRERNITDAPMKVFTFKTHRKKSWNQWLWLLKLTWTQKPWLDYLLKVSIKLRKIQQFLERKTGLLKLLQNPSWKALHKAVIYTQAD